jgi:hypothetical protein
MSDFPLPSPAVREVVEQDDVVLSGVPTNLRRRTPSQEAGAQRRASKG